jgi:DNA uptake protein ComE-like DNA-binding protein
LSWAENNASADPNEVRTKKIYPKSEFAFNPNTIDADALKKLGLPPWIHKNIQSYHQNIGQFKYKEDFKRLYGLKPDEYERLEAFIELPSKPEKTTAAFEKNSFAKSEFNFNPNTIDADALKKLGLPPWIHKNIQSYHQNIGQFKYKEDFKRLYGLKPEEYERLEAFIELPSKPDNAPVKSENKGFVKSEFNFDPNTIDSISLKKLGLAPWLYKNIKTYQQKVGKFRYKEDFQRLYGLKPEDYQRLEPFVQLPNKPTSTPVAEKSTSPPKPLEINNATLEEWIKLPSVSPQLAAKIMKYKQNLGGFININQVSEIYGLPDSVYMKISSYLRIENGSVRQINLNTASLDELKKHPYLAPWQAQEIVDFREKNGPIKTIEQLLLLKSYTNKQHLYKKIKPYITI